MMDLRSARENMTKLGSTRGEARAQGREWGRGTGSLEQVIKRRDILPGRVEVEQVNSGTLAPVM